MKFILQFSINLPFLQSISLFSNNYKHRGTQINLFMEVWKGSTLGFSVIFLYPFLKSMQNFLMHVQNSPIED